MLYPGDVVGAVAYNDLPSAAAADNGSTDIRRAVHTKSLVWSIPCEYTYKGNDADGVGTDGPTPAYHEAVGEKHELTITASPMAGGKHELTGTMPSMAGGNIELTGTMPPTAGGILESKGTTLLMPGVRET